MTTWHKAPTLAGNPQGRRHFDIGSDDGENIALVYPSETSAAETTARANLFVASRELLAALKESTVALINRRDVDFDSETNANGEYDSLSDRELIAKQDAQIAKNQAAIGRAEGKDA